MSTFYTMQEVADMLRVSYWTIRRQVDAGFLKGYKIGGDWRFTEDQLTEYLEQRHVDKSKRKKQTA